MHLNNVSNKILSLISLIRLLNPTGYILLFIPCVIGTGLYENITSHYNLIILFLLGSIIMRSAGCIINDIFDKDIDKNIERTKNRPLANGDLSITEALVLFITLNIIGLIVLLQLSIEAIVFGVIAAFLFVIYPLMKRITFWPQLFLGITYNTGILIAALNIKHEITITSIIAYIGCVFWTLYYDTIYAFMDLRDDKKIGVKSLAVFLEKRNYKLWLSIFAILALSLIISSLYISNHNIYSLIIATLLSLSLIMWQITTLKINLPSNCLLRFKSNNYLGIIWAFTSVI